MEDTSIKLLCPATNAVVSTGISFGADPAATRRAHLENNRFECPACGAMHVWDKVAGETLATVRS